MLAVKLPSPEDEIKAVPSSKFGSLATPDKKIKNLIQKLKTLVESMINWSIYSGLGSKPIM